MLWALGEQSPLAVRGQTMQDVIFAGGQGQSSRSSAEVEIVIDNGGGEGFSEISIVRRLERSGEGEYRLNGARCRLVDVIDTLSDTGLGKEMHSVVSQGRVEAIIHSKPRDRRLLVEEAAGLGKHRKRRRRAQLKLEHTGENLARAGDVEREARSRLRPLKRQAEAAALHARLERQSLEARFELVIDDLTTRARELERREAEVSRARAERDGAGERLAEITARRDEIEREFREHSRLRERRSAALHSARSAAERIMMRLERARDLERASVDAVARRDAELEALEAAAAAAPSSEAENERLAELERELLALREDRERRLERELAQLRAERDAVARRSKILMDEVATRRDDRESSERAVEAARKSRTEAERAVEQTRRAAASLGAELASVNHFLRSAGGAIGAGSALADEITVTPGFEQVVAAVLGPLLRATLADDLEHAGRLLDGARDGGSTLLAGLRRASPAAPRPPAQSARRLRDVVDVSAAAESIVDHLLADVWLVESLDGLAAGFSGVAATPAGRVLFARTGEVRQVPASSEREILERRNRRAELIVDIERAAEAESSARAKEEAAAAALSEAHAAREGAEADLRSSRRSLDEAAEALRRAEWLIERRREAPDEGPSAVRAAELAAELRAERLLAEQASRLRTERARRVEWLRLCRAHDTRVASSAQRVSAALAAARQAVDGRRSRLREALTADEAVAERTAANLRACAQEEAELQARLRAAGELVTDAEVRAQRLRDSAADAKGMVAEIAARLGVEPRYEAAEPLAVETRERLDITIGRLEQRREQLGPVNALAREEYEQAVAHVEELEGQRRDLEHALAELERVIRETDRQIRQAFEETFAAAARNFEETVAHLFPGGRGRLRLVRPEGPRAVAEDADPDDGQPERPDDAAERDEPGVEIEVTPAGKATKRLSLMSGGEKSLVALAFLFAVFLARPCPFYILDEVEAALDDSNIDRFLQLVRRFADRAQFIVVTHQKRTMDAADTLYGVSMGADGVSKVVSRKLSRETGLDSLDVARRAA